MRMLIVMLVACSGSGQKPAPSTPQTSGCPATAPADRTSCTTYLQKCSYPREARCPASYCADVASQLVWITTYDHCALVCPEAKPVAGSPCGPVSSQPCDYKGGSKCGFRSSCTANGWAEEEITLCGGM
jgi:hypothetical protein